MREIKFRAWDESDKEKGPYMLGPYDLTDAIFNNKEIRKLPLMQFTGLHDKNGKEIYEGDIVKPVKFNDIINTVEYISHGFYRVKRHNGKPYLNALGSCDVIIIGNIYENPTLIK
jgi:uncharacterized phage protein (TIGR01671 family)